MNTSINIEQDNKKYLLTIKIKGEEMTLVLSEPEEIGNSSFIKIITLKDIKEMHSYFNGLDECNTFSDYLKALSENKKLSVVKKEDNLCLNFTIEYMLKNYLIELILSPEKKNPEQLIKDLCREMNSLKERIKILENKNDNKEKNEIKEVKNIIENLKIENQNLKEEIKKLKEQIKNKEEENKEIQNMKEEIKETKKLIEPIDKKFKEININRYTTFNEKSVIIKENEFDFIKKAMNYRFNKEIKEIKKIYQATIDGDSAINFHSKCDGIPNTLVIIKSAGNRRFGGFTSEYWNSSYSDKYPIKWGNDENAFLFSIDKQAIYPYNGINQSYDINNHKILKNSSISKKDWGPLFGGDIIFVSDRYQYYKDADIFIGSNCIHEKNSYTYESCSHSSYNFGKDKNALSEDGKKSNIYISEYEVFQIIFT